MRVEIDKEKQITQIELKEFLDYNQDTGAFVWLVNRGRLAKKGDVAGHRHSDGYVRIKIKGKLYSAHRLAWLYVENRWPEHQVDHENHIHDDNRWSNLLEATHQENQKNAPKRKDNTSGITGVSWRVRDGAWQSYIQVDGEQTNLMQSKDFFEACCARKSADNKYGYHTNHGRAYDA